MLVLEEEGHARARGATILAELRSVGLSSYAHHTMCVCMYICMHVCMYVCTYLRVYGCIPEDDDGYDDDDTIILYTGGRVRAQPECMYVCIYACMHFLTGEGAGVLVLEEEGHARARGATILAELRSVGLSSDGHHITSPPADGDGALRAMEAALRLGNVRCEYTDGIPRHSPNVNWAGAYGGH